MNEENAHLSRAIDLDSILSRLIADQLGIEAKDVTVGFLMDQRQKQIYPKALYDFGSLPGGERILLTRGGFKAIEDAAGEFMRHIRDLKAYDKMP